MTSMSATGQPPVGTPATSGALRMTPARWVTLAVAVPVALALIGWTGFGLVALAARGSYSFSYPLPVRDGQVALNVNSGNVTLRQGRGNVAQLTGIVQYGLFRPGISEFTTPTGTSFGVGCGAIATGNCGVSGTLDVPARTAVALWSNGGDIGASGFSGNMSLSAGGGNLNVSGLTGDLLLDTGGGDLTGSGLTGTIQITAEGGNVDASDLNGPTRIDTGGGDLTGTGYTGDLQIVSEGGNVDAAAVASQQITAQSGGGDVTLSLTQPPQNLQITADGGNVTVTLPPGSAKYDISTPDTQGGSVQYLSSLFSSASPHKITVDSGGGDITISQG